VVNRRSSTVLAIFPFIAYWTKTHGLSDNLNTFWHCQK